MTGSLPSKLSTNLGFVKVLMANRKGNASTQMIAWSRESEVTPKDRLKKDREGGEIERKEEERGEREGREREREEKRREKEIRTIETIGGIVK